MLLLKLLPHSCLLSLVSVLQFEVDVTEEVLLTETQLLESVVVGFLRHGVLHLLKLILVNLEVRLDSIRLSVLLVRVLLEHELKHLFLLSELLHQEASHSFEELVTQVLVQELKLVLSLLRRVISLSELLLEEASDVLFRDLFLLLVFLLEELDLVLHALFLELMLLLVLPASEEKCPSCSLLLFLPLAIFLHASSQSTVSG